MPRTGDLLEPLLRGLPPHVASVVRASAFRTVVGPASWPVAAGVPEIEAVIRIDGPVEGEVAADLLDALDAAEREQRLVLLVADDAGLRDRAKARLAELLAGRRQAGGRA